MWWLGSQLACLMLYMPCHFVLRRENSPNNLAIKYRASLLLIVVVGLSWFVFPFLMLPGTDILILTVMTISICVAPFTTAATVTLISFPGFLIYAGMMYTGLVIAALQQTDFPPLIVQGFMALLFSFLVLQSYRINSRMITTLRSKIESQRAYAAAEKANRDKSTFIASASHDIRQPLQACIFIVDNLYRKAPEALVPLVDNLDQSVSTMRGLLDGLLDISKLDAGVIECEPVYIDLRQVVSAVIDGFSERALHEDKPLIVDVGRYVVHTDPTLLKRILSNLIDNALKYSTAGNSIQVTTTTRGETLVLTVEDHGKGIGEYDQASIFEEFYQVDNPERDHTKGLGLGLAIVHRLTQLLDIALSFKSTPDIGTTITLSMPFYPQRTVEISEENSERPDTDVVGLRVLLIEDQAVVRETLAHVLTHWQCEVATADGIDQAIEHATTADACGQPIDVIISDYRLREGTTGTQAITAINEIIQYPAQSIVITGESNPDELRDAEAIADTLMLKPIEPAQLKAAMGRLLDI